MMILTLCWFPPTGMLWAQWTEKDSVRLKEALSGQEEIRLRPEVLKAIESGTLIHTDETLNQLLSAPPVLPITRDFTDAGERLGSSVEDIDPESVPPSVYKLYELQSGNKLKVDSNAFRWHSPLVEKTEFQLGHLPVTAAVKADNLFLYYVKVG
ncbi:MAG: DUF4858 domain-containing protein [Tannerellaceae bacterium]|nr:DUF4858 domain-containing protein [Tannerellaceae bacterium]